jgi:hypothetical protein
MKLLNFSLEDIKKLAYLNIVLNETDNISKKWNHLLLAHSPNSGLSFGPIQFDISVSGKALELLNMIGMNDVEIGYLKSIKYKDIKHEHLLMKNPIIQRCNNRLQYHIGFIIDQSIKYVNKSIDRIINLKGLEELWINPYMMIFFIDYHNQFHFSTNGKLHNWLKGKSCITLDDFMAYKYSLKWGESELGQNDIERRFNITKKFCLKNKLMNRNITKQKMVKIDPVPAWLNTDDEW